MNKVETAKLSLCHQRQSLFIIFKPHQRHFKKIACYCTVKTTVLFGCPQNQHTIYVILYLNAAGCVVCNF